MSTQRRLFAQALFLGSMALAASFPAFAQEAPIKTVYHLSEGIPQASRAMNNIRNHLSADPKARIVVVTHGARGQALEERAHLTRVAARRAAGVGERTTCSALVAHPSFARCSSGALGSAGAASEDLPS